MSTAARGSNARNKNAARNSPPRGASNAAARNADPLPVTVSPSPSPRLPLSGSESPFNELSLYSAKRGVGNNNCYAYAIDTYANTGSTKLQPGNISKSPGELNLGSCAALKGRALADLKGRAYAVDAGKACGRGEYKVMAFLSKDRDYHWYRQHRDAMVRLSDKMRDLAALARALGVRPSQLQSPSKSPKPGDLVLVKDAALWSHKQGFATVPLLRDACGKAITDPRRACRNYGDLNYTEYCGAFCIKKRA